jgi:predicted AAA+ superfamily ATPase
LGDYGLYYLRDKDKREVDFLVTKDRKPWFLVEVKTSGNGGLSRWLYYYQEKLKVPHAFQVTFDLPYVDQDCFKHKTPVIVPAKTFLSQLI